jgi:tRNA(Ile)-lysidine synthase
MIRLLGKIPENFYLACSGGVDSMVALDFFLTGRYKPTVINFDHGTEFGDESRKFLRKRCDALGLPLIVNKIGDLRHPGKSIEEHWRDERYIFFNSIPGTIITAHHLDDAAEWWVFSSLHGQSKLIPYRRENVIRPFLLTPKSELLDWAKRKKIEFMNDPGNKDEKYMRSIIRHKIMPEAFRINPGLRKVVKKKLEEENENL